MSNITPAPWRVERKSDSLLIKGPNGEILAGIPPNEEQTNDLANAHAMAQTPNFIDVLTECRGKLEAQADFESRSHVERSLRMTIASIDAALAAAEDVEP